MSDTFDGIKITGLMAGLSTPKGPQLSTPEGASQGCSEDELAEARAAWEKIPHCAKCGLPVPADARQMWEEEVVRHWECTAQYHWIVKLREQLADFHEQVDALRSERPAAGPWRTDEPTTNMENDGMEILVDVSPFGSFRSLTHSHGDAWTFSTRGTKHVLRWGEDFVRWAIINPPESPNSGQHERLPDENLITVSGAPVDRVYEMLDRLAAEAWRKRFFVRFERKPITIYGYSRAGEYEYWRQSAVTGMERANVYRVSQDFDWWAVKQWLRDYRSGDGVRG